MISRLGEKVVVAAWLGLMYQVRQKAVFVQQCRTASVVAFSVASLWLVKIHTCH